MNSFYIIDESSQQQLGPFTPQELQARKITPTTMVWATGLDDWKQAGLLRELRFIFDSTAQIPAQTPPPSIPVTPPQPTRTNQSKFDSNVYGNVNSLGQGLDTGLAICPKTWLIESVLMTILCCLPLGIAALVYSSKVEPRFRAGDYEGSEKASRYAKNTLLGGLITTLVGGTLYVIFIVILGVMGTF